MKNLSRFGPFLFPSFFFNFLEGNVRPASINLACALLVNKEGGEMKESEPAQRLLDFQSAKLSGRAANWTARLSPHI